MNLPRHALDRLGLTDFFHHLLAPACRRCERPLPLHTHAPGLCNPCWTMVYEPTMIQDPNIHLHTWACGRYTQFMAQQLLQAKRKATPSAMNFWKSVLDTRACTFEAQPWEVLVPMPFHPWRLMRRGYSLPHWMAHHLHQIWPHLPVESLLIKARRKAQTQQSSFAKRAKNIQGAFSVKGDVSNQRILLIDDVRTSGATLAEATKTLYQAGAKKIDAFVLLQAPKRKK